MDNKAKLTIEYFCQEIDMELSVNDNVEEVRKNENI
jgi:hypothetical protein